MKKVLTLFLALSSFNLCAQFINSTMMHDGLERSFQVYLPANYQAGVEWPLVFNLHGFGSDNVQQGIYTAFTPIADTANFILCLPTGTPTPFGNGFAWDVNFPNDPEEVDDVGFISALIDLLHADYNINLDKVYSTGMSNGGFMSYKLACELPDRFQAIASVTGSMVPSEFAACMLDNPFPVMQIHGTADSTVPFEGANIGVPIEELVAHWADHNNCITPADTLFVEESPTTDQCSAIRISYTNCDEDSEVIFYKIVGGGHTWPGALFPIGITNQDINASVEIWNFFNQYGEDIVTSNNNITADLSLSLHPNPTRDQLLIRTGKATIINFRVLNNLGQLVFTKNEVNHNDCTLETSAFPTGLYFIEIQTDRGTTSQQFVKL